jgi:hypothetical protein
LAAARAQGIAMTLRDDMNWFACHETTGAKGGRRVRRADQSHCAGAMRVLMSEGCPNVAMRIAHCAKLIDLGEIGAADWPCFKNLDEFAEHHAKEKTRA